MSASDQRFKRPTAKPEHAGKDYGRIGQPRGPAPTGRFGEPLDAEGESRQFTAIVFLLVFIIIAIIWGVSKWRG